MFAFLVDQGWPVAPLGAGLLRAQFAAMPAGRKRKQTSAAEQKGSEDVHGPGKTIMPTGAGTPTGKSQRKSRKAAVDIPEPAQLCFSTAEPKVHIGTSGYSYDHWKKGTYYPQGLPAAREFEMYAKEFNFLEINATFYGWFSEETFDSWKERAAAARPSFTYAVKASQFYTHKKRLNVDTAFTENWGRFWERCQRLRPHLGPLLFQFPSNFKTTSKRGSETVSNIDKLRRLGEVLPRGEKFVFEFRDASWFCPEVYAVLKEHDWCLAMVEVHDQGQGESSSSAESEAPAKSWAGTLRMGANPPPDQYPLDCCSWGVYVRYHGASGQYQGTYGKRAMERWADRTAKWVASGRTVYHAFNNDSVARSGQAPSAILDSRHLAGALRRMGMLT